MEETEDEKIQRLIKEGIEKANAEKPKKSFVKKLLIGVGFFVITTIIILFAIGFIVTNYIYPDIPVPTESTEPTVDDVAIAEANKLISVCDSEFTKAGGFDMTYSASTKDALESCRDAISYVNMNRADIGGVNANIMALGIENKVDILKVKINIPKYSTYTAKNTVKMIYPTNEFTKNYEKVLDCNSFCDEFETLTAEDIKISYQEQNDFTIDRVTITTQSPGFILFIIFSSGIDTSSGEKYMRSDTISYTAKTASITPYPSQTSKPINGSSGSNNLNYQYWKGDYPNTIYPMDNGERVGTITGIPFMVMKYNRISNDIEDILFGMTEITQTGEIPEPTLDPNAITGYKELGLDSPVILFVSWNVQYSNSKLDFTNGVQSFSFRKPIGVGSGYDLWKFDYDSVSMTGTIENHEDDMMYGGMETVSKGLNLRRI